MSGTFTSTGSYSNLTRLELEQLRKADFYAGGKALTVGDAGNVGGGTGVGSINAEPYSSGPLLSTGNIDWVTPPTDPVLNIPFRVDTSDNTAGIYEDPIFWFGPIGLGRFDGTATATNQITKSSGTWNAINGDIAVIASGHADNVYAVGTVSAGGGTAVLTLTNIRNAANGTTLTVSGTTHSVIMTRPDVAQLLAVPGSGPIGREQTFMFCQQYSTIHNTVSPTAQNISDERVRNIVPPSFNGPGNDRSDAIFDSPRSIANTVGYRPVFYRGLADGSGPDLTSPIATLNPVIDSTIPAADQRMTIDYKAGIVRFSCAPRAGDDIKPTGGIGGVNSTTGRLNLYAVWFAFPTANPAQWFPIGGESSKQLYYPRSTSSQGTAPATVLFNGVSWVITPGIAASVTSTWANTNTVSSTTLSTVLNEIVSDLATNGADKVGTEVGSFAGALSSTGGGGILSSSTTIQSSLDRVDDMLVARRGFTAVVTDGTNSVGGDINTTTPFSNMGSLGGGTFLLRRGDYQVSDSSVAAVDHVLIGEQGSRNVSLTHSGSGSPIPFSQSSLTGLNSFENIDFISASGLYGYFSFGDGTAHMRHCQFKAGGLEFRPLSIGLRLQIEGLHIFENDVAIQRDSSVEFKSQVNQEATGIVRGLSISHVPSWNNATQAKYAMRHVTFVPTATTDIDALTFENANLSITTGFAAGNGAVFRSEASTANVIFNGCLFRQAVAASAAGVLEIDGSSNLTFNDCTFEQAGIGKVLSIVGATTNNIKFKNCKFYTSNLAALSQEFYVACGSIDTPPVVFENCVVYLRYSSTSVTHRMEFNSLNEMDVPTAKGSLSIDGLKVILDFTGGAISPRFFYVNSTTASYGALLSFNNLSFYLNSNTLRVASEYAIVFSTGSTPCFIEDLNIHGVKEPVAPATTNTCYLVYLKNAHVLNGSLHGDSTVSGLAWRAMFDLDHEATLTKFLFHANDNVVRGRCVRITGNYVVVHACKALVSSIHADESASGWFCSITDSLAHCEVTDNKIAMTTGVGLIGGLSSTLAIINTGVSSAFGHGHHIVTGNSFTAFTEVAFILSDARYSRISENTYDQIGFVSGSAPTTIRLDSGEYNQVFGNILHNRTAAAPLITYDTQTGTIPIAANIDTYNTRI